ncbi:winged helix-turn-helix domain-containing protein [Ferrimonas marina]|uniref:DNA-binding winged helix-turn-helix (WHTH) domain-containing protein n=1 Tax=Ferrimonas marina TaxID=299255 RepID=A0A1M5X1F5_9GAMM|nr:helix-turn-helix domain-containing protein [Ferrimonas marina]SHH93697.1 DNA-binding winged helix-turn-helix (wHTH) domain-containing protein [Ferrimonas marina]
MSKTQHPNLVHIGTCSFLPDTKRLLHTNGEQWDLPRAECQVLTLLVAERGRPVDKLRLRCGEFDQPQVGESAVARAVFQLRNFLEDEDHTLIETIKGVGYRLANEPQAGSAEQQIASPSVDSVEPQPSLAAIKPQPAQEKPTRVPWWVRNRALSLLLVGVLLVLLLLTHASYFIRTQASSGFEPRQISHGDVTLHWYSPSTGHGLDQQALSDRILKSLAQCPEAPWESVYIALSSDQQGLSVTLVGHDEGGQLKLRNLKVVDTRLRGDFAPEQWFQKGGLCD